MRKVTFLSGSGEERFSPFLCVYISPESYSLYDNSMQVDQITLPTSLETKSSWKNRVLRFFVVFTFFEPLLLLEFQQNIIKAVLKQLE